MKYFILLFFICITSMMVSQNYTEKYNDLYNRYEYFGSDGRMVGYKKYNTISQQWEYTDLKSSNNSQSDRNRAHDYGEVKSNFNTDLAIQALSYKQARFDKQIAQTKAQQSAEKNIDREKSINRMNQIINYYNSANSVPTTIRDGWHLVWVMNNYDFCDQRKVYVSDNKITQYVIDDWDHRTITYSLPIQYAKTSIKLQEADDELLSVFFIDDIANPNSISIPPIKSGKVSLWTDFKKGYIDIYIENEFVGTLKSHFEKGAPNCGQQGTVLFENIPGTYSYVAKANGLTWRGTITITSNGCSLLKLSKG